MTVMPMFPLGMVLLPGGVLPMHVFEPRYRQLVIDCLSAQTVPEFGQVLITHGSEAGGGDERAMIGTIAQMVNIEALDDGRYAMVTVGTRRIKINRWLPDDPYPVADVDDWPDAVVVGPDIATHVSSLHERVRAVLTLAAELGDVPADLVDSVISDDPMSASYQLASLAPIGPADRFRLLATDGPSERLALLSEVLDDVEAMLKFRLI